MTAQSFDGAPGAADARAARNARLYRVLAENVPLLVLIVLFIASALLSDRFLTPFNLGNVLLQASVISVLAMGMTFVIISGGFDISVGSIVALCGCVAAWVMLAAGPLAGVLAGIGVGALCGLANGLLVARVGLNPFIATMGTMVILRGITLLMTHGQPISGDEGLPRIFLDYARTSVFGLPLLTWTTIAVFIVFGWLLHQSVWGKRLFATGGNTEAAFLAGIPVARMRTMAYVISGVSAGIAGVMLASRLQSGQPTAAEGYELNAIAAVILGGAALHGGEGRLHMTLVGVFVIIILSNILNLLNVDSYWQRIAVGSVIVIAAAVDQLRRRRH